MTRNRDDFTVFQALRTGIIGIVAIIVLMTALGLAMSIHKDAAENRATVVAASALQFQTGTVEVADNTARML